MLNGFKIYLDIMLLTKINIYVLVINFIDLRKQARRLETEIDSMLLSLSKISTNNPMMYSDDESQLLLSDDRFETATSEIEELLSKVKLPLNKCT